MNAMASTQLGAPINWGEVHARTRHIPPQSTQTCHNLNWVGAWLCKTKPRVNPSHPTAPC